jgi:hypothetical protein
MSTYHLRFVGADELPKSLSDCDVQQFPSPYLSRGNSSCSSSLGASWSVFRRARVPRPLESGSREAHNLDVDVLGHPADEPVGLG